MSSAQHIARYVLTKLSEESSSWNTPQLVAAGGALGATGGTLYEGISHLNDIKHLLDLKQQEPRLRQSKATLSDILSSVRQQHPDASSLPDRRLAKRVLESEIPNDVYHATRKGYDEGITGLSRVGKSVPILKKRLMRAGLLGAGLGLGAGVGGGLLTAMGLGNFDD
jgi:hypothetical protein